MRLPLVAEGQYETEPRFKLPDPTPSIIDSFGSNICHPECWKIRDNKGPLNKRYIVKLSTRLVDDDATPYSTSSWLVSQQCAITLCPHVEKLKCCVCAMADWLYIMCRGNIKPRREKVIRTSDKLAVCCCLLMVCYTWSLFHVVGVLNCILFGGDYVTAWSGGCKTRLTVCCFCSVRNSV